MKTRVSNPLQHLLNNTAGAATVAVVFTSLIPTPASAEDYWWDSNGAAAGFGDAGGTWAAPTVGGATQGWSTDPTGATTPGDVTTTFGDAVRFGSGTDTIGPGTVAVDGTVEANSIIFNAGSGPVTIDGGTIALGGGGAQIRANRAGQAISSAIQLNSNAQLIAGINGNPVLHFQGPISGEHNVTFTTPNSINGTSGQGTFIRLSAASTYTGNTLLTTANQNNRLFLQSLVDDALPATTVLTLDGGKGAGTGREVILELSGKNQTLAGLTNVPRDNRPQRIRNNSGSTSVITLDTAGDFSFSGNLIGDALSVVKTGPGTQTLAAGNSYSGTTTIRGGKLVGVVGGNHGNSDVILDDESATYGIAITDSANSWTCKSLTFTAAGTLECDFGAVPPSPSVSPLVVADLADFVAATPTVKVIFTAEPFPGTYPLITWGAVDGTVPGTQDLDVTGISGGSVATLSVTGNTLNLVIAGSTPGVVKANNTDNLNLGSSWVGGVTPSAGDIAEWNATVTSANSTVLGADQTWAGVKIKNPSGPVTIGGADLLSIGAALLDIDMSEATADLTLNAPIEMTDAHLWDIGENRTATIGGEVSGAFSITKLGLGTAALGGFNTYSGDTIISAGTLRIDTDDSIPFGGGFGGVTVDGTLDLNGFNQGINSLNGSGRIENSNSGQAATLTVGENNGSGTFDGVIGDDSFSNTVNLVKTGTGTLVLGGENTMIGTATVTGGTLAFSNVSPLEFSAGIQLAGGATLRPDVVNAAISVPITVGAAGTVATITAPSIQGAGGSNPVLFTLDSPVSGDGAVVFLGVESTNAYGTIILNSQSTYAGSTLLTCSGGNMNLFVRLGDENALPTTTVLTLDGGNGAGSGRFCELDLRGNDQTLAGLENVGGRNLRTQRIRNTGATPATLTVDGSGDHIYSAGLGNGGNNMGLTKAGPGTLTLSGNNAYTGATTITGGTLALGASDVLADATHVAIGDGTLAIGSGFTDTVGTLAISGNAGINLGPGAVLSFAGSSGESWTGSLTLTGNFVSGASLRFGTDATGLTAGQLASISGPGLSDVGIDANGFLTATVEAGGYSDWAAINVGGQGPDEDFDGDGMPNGVEFFLDAAPGFTPNPQLDGANSITWTNGGNLPASDYGTRFVVQTSGNLVDWDDVPVGNLAENSGDIGVPGNLTYTLTGAAPRFVRLKVMPE